MQLFLRLKSLESQVLELVSRVESLEERTKKVKNDHFSLSEPEITALTPDLAKWVRENQPGKSNGAI
jgi:hypothetical protein